MKRIILFFVCACGIGVIILTLRPTAPAFKETEPPPFPSVAFSAQDRILILAPHPDDEVLGCGGIIQKALRLNLPVKVVFLTYGDNNQWSFLVYRKHPVFMPKAVQRMGLVRHNEALAATKALGLSPEQLVFLGYPDFRTLEMWYRHWGSSPPEESMLSQVKAVPYASAFRPGTPYKSEEILKDLKTIISDFQPTQIYVSHPADHNPDHRALYLFTRIALWDLGLENDIKMFPYLIHFQKWPQPQAFQPLWGLWPPDFLKDSVAWFVSPVSGEDLVKKFAALKMHRSQYEASPGYLGRFIRKNELFGDFPAISFPGKEGGFSVAEEHRDISSGAPEELINKEKTSYVGIRSYSVSAQDGTLIFRVKLSRPVGETVGLSLYIFGYRKDTPFAAMPKIHVKFGALKHTILDQNQVLARQTVRVTRHPKEIVIALPAATLGNPDRVLSSARTYLGTVPLDWVAWRVIEFPGQSAEGGTARDGD